MISAPWRAALLGRAQLLGPGPALDLERKAAALLAYLALEGPTSRARLAGLLWPDTREAAARNNLVQLLRKMRVTTGQEPVTGADVLSLGPDFQVDALEARALITQGRPAEFAAVIPALLSGLTYDDCPDLDDWLTAERARWTEWHVAALRATSADLERSGDLDGALAWAQRLSDADTVSEEAWRRVMRLQYLRGDRPAALRAYHRCVEMLAREFGSEPLPETAALAREIERGAVAALPRPVTTPPLATLRPPRLLGREAAWAQLEAAWARGQWLIISGEPGVGKTRLALDFAASRGAFVVCPGRPGDAAQPLATTARALRSVLHVTDAPGEPWVRRELARVLPDLAPDDPLPPMTAEADALRFRQAQRALYHTLPPAVKTVIADDWQAFDPGSQLDLEFVFSSAAPLGEPGGLPGLILTYRRGELSERALATLRGLEEQGAAAHVHLEPLRDDDGPDLLDDLEVPRDPTLRGALWRHAGGNPLFLLETVRLLHKTGDWQGGAQGDLPLPDKVRALIGRRLENLSPRALQAARAAAALQRDYDLELVAEVLGTPLVDVASAWEELETAQVAAGERLTHDLILESVDEGTPASVRALLHRSAARALARTGAAAARVGRHWQEGGRPADAAAAYGQAAQDARGRYQLLEAARLHGLAAALHADAGQPQAAFEQLNAQLTLFDATGAAPDEFRDALERLAALARGAAQQGLVTARRAEYLGLMGEQDAMAQVAQEGAALAQAAGDQRLEARLLEITAVAHLKLGRPRAALPALERLRTLGQLLGEVPVQALALQGLGLVYQVSSPREALAVYREAQTLGQDNDLRGRVAILTRVAHMQAVLGDVRAAAQRYGEALALLEGSEGLLDVHLLALYGRANVHLTLGDPVAAWQDVETARQLDPQQQVAVTAQLGLARALVLRAFAQLPAALAAVEATLEHPAFQANLRPRAHAIRGSVLADLGQLDAALAAFGAAEEALGPEPGVALHAEVLARRAAVEAPTTRLKTAQALLGISEAHDLRGFRDAALLHAAVARAALGTGRALPPAPQPDGHPVCLPGELWQARADVTRQLGLDGLDDHAAAVTWWRHLGEAVPEAFRAEFHARHLTPIAAH